MLRAVAVVLLSALAARLGSGCETVTDQSQDAAAALLVGAAAADGATRATTGHGEKLLKELFDAADATFQQAYVGAPEPPMAAEAAAAAAEARGLFHYHRQGPVYPASQFPALQKLQQNWEVMRSEAVTVTRDLDLFRTHQDFSHPSSIEILKQMFEKGNDGWITVGWANDRDWQNFGMVYRDHPMPGLTQQLCPQTVALLTSIPGIRLAGLSKLTPNAHIETHTDYTGLKQRSLSFHVYLTGYARMRVENGDGDDDDLWVEHIPGGMVLFDTNVPHEVFNSDVERIILYGDLDIDIFFWKTEGLDLRAQSPLTQA